MIDDLVSRSSARVARACAAAVFALAERDSPQVIVGDRLIKPFLASGADPPVAPVVTISGHPLSRSIDMLDLFREHSIAVRLVTWRALAVVAVGTDFDHVIAGGSPARWVTNGRARIVGTDPVGHHQAAAIVHRAADRAATATLADLPVHQVVAKIRLAVVGAVDSRIALACGNQEVVSPPFQQLPCIV